MTEQHGTYRQYQRGCRCQPCTQANNEHSRAWRARQQLHQNTSGCITKLLHLRETPSPFRIALTRHEVMSARATPAAVPHKVQSELWGEW